MINKVDSCTFLGGILLNNDNCLQISVDIDQWKNLSVEERMEQTFYCLRYLTGVARRDKLIERLIMFSATLTANLILMIPLVMFLIEHFNKK